MLQELSVVEQRYLAVEEVLDGAKQVAAVNLRDRLRLCIPEAAIGPSSRL
jgi:hypothetical protein